MARGALLLDVKPDARRELSRYLRAGLPRPRTAERRLRLPARRRPACPRRRLRVPHRHARAGDLPASAAASGHADSACLPRPDSSCWPASITCSPWTRRHSLAERAPQLGRHHAHRDPRRPPTRPRLEPATPTARCRSPSTLTGDHRAAASSVVVVSQLE